MGNYLLSLFESPSLAFADVEGIMHIPESSDMSTSPDGSIMGLRQVGFD